MLEIYCIFSLLIIKLKFSKPQRKFEDFLFINHSMENFQCTNYNNIRGDAMVCLES